MLPLDDGDAANRQTLSDVVRVALRQEGGDRFMWRHRVCVTAAAIAPPVCSGPQAKDGQKVPEPTKEKTEILGGGGEGVAGTDCGSANWFRT